MRQFLTLYLPVAVVILAVAFAFADMRTSAQLDQIIATERANLQQLSGYLAAEASSSLNHLRDLAREAALAHAIDSPSPGNRQALQSVFMTMARRNPDYQQIRWIDEAGTERVRVMRDQGRLFAVDDQHLQDKSNRYYFKAANALLVGELYISRLDLNMENGQIETPLRPTLRVATPLQDSRGQHRGILVINLTMRYMLAAIRSARERNIDTEYILVNQDGYWLTAPKQQDMNTPALEPDYLFSKQHPAAWDRISTSHASSAELKDGFWIWETLAPEETIRRVSLGSGTDIDAPGIYSDELSLKLVAHKPIRALTELRRDSRVLVMLGAILLLGFYAWGLLFFLRGQLMEKQADINVAYARAHASQMERLKELEERFRLLVEASSVGMVVVDAEGIILMSNPSAESMLGYNKGALNGRSVDSLLPDSQREQHAQLRKGFLRHPEVRKMGQGRKLEALTADGRRIPVEVGLNPYLDHGKQVVLASIIDLSRR